MNLNFIAFAKRHTARISKLVLAILAVAYIMPVAQADSAGSLTSLKDTLGTSRPSVATAITVAVTAGDTTINVANTNGIVQGDTINVCVGQQSCSSNSETAVVASVVSLTKLALTLGTANSYTTSGYVYYKSASVHTVVLVTRSTVSGGSFLLTLPAGTVANTTTPASAGFVFNNISTSTDISASGFTAATTTTSTSGSNLTVSFTFTGSVASNTTITLTVGSTTKLLNPTKTAAQGTADTFSAEVDEKDGSGNIIDTTTAKVGTIEPVTVSATVAPSLTFTINGVSSGTTVANISTDQTSTATTVPFGTLTVGATSTIAQYIHIDTNSNSGYAVTAQQDGSLRKSNGTSIVDFTTAETEQDGNVGFGYSLQNKTGTDASFLFNDSSRKFSSKGFSSSSPITIMSNAGAVSGSEVYVAYRVKVNSTQAQGNYQNVVTYIATATY